jgi:hypothetical protein
MRLRIDLPSTVALRGQASLVREAIDRCLKTLAAEHPDWFARDDARSACFESLWNIARYAELSLHVLQLHLSSAEWWSHFSGPSLSPDEIAVEFTGYSQCSKVAVFHLCFSAVENSHRSFLRALEPGTPKRGRGDYSAVYRRLLPLLGAREADRQLLDLLRTIRNTLHNQGVHAPETGGSRKLTHAGVEYNFRDGAPLAFVTWQFVLDRAMDLVQLQERLIHHPLLAACHHIRDASATPFSRPAA